MLLSPETRHRIKKEYNVDSVPTTAITLGLGNILHSSRVMTMAWGEDRAGVVAEAMEGPVTENVDFVLYYLQFVHGLAFMLIYNNGIS